MSSSTTTTTGDGSAPRAPRNFRRGNRGRRGNANRRQQQESTQSSEAQRPPQPQSQPQNRPVARAPAPTPSVPQSQNTPQSSDSTPSNTTGQRSRRGPRRRRGGRGGGNTSADGEGQRQSPVRGGDKQIGSGASRRTFGGRLTKSQETSEDDRQQAAEDTEDPGLRANAPAFVPGSVPPVNGETPSSSNAASAKGKGKAKAPRQRAPKVTTKSEAEDITTRIHEDIAHNLYECPICTSEVGRKTRVWSCGLCWTVFHLSCVKKWSKNEGAAAQDPSRNVDRRCNAAKAVTSKGQLQQPQRLSAVTPLSCDDECARLERNRSLAAALGVDINPSTTLAQNAITSTNLPYSTETLDLYVQLSSTSSLSTLQSHESTLHSLATSTNPSQRSIRTQPAKSSIRAFIHSLATDYGFVSESYDPEPHRHVFVLKPTTWTPPIFGLGNGVSVGIGGMSVSECVKLRERQRAKEREAQRLVAAEAKAQRDASKAQASSEGGWAQIAASKRGNGVTGSARSTPLSRTPVGSGSFYTALALNDDGSGFRKEKLVLRSGVGAGKAASRRPSPPRPVEVADSWEEEEDKEEKEEEERRAKESEAEASSSAGTRTPEVVDVDATGGP
ncbi:putative NF-X1 finger transcription factor [Aspergillus mulundensis]|uniref:R3H domain-containing protein n=1 Tax=Aspergillus mulundensis TaxID=1810919 RepID=A0A3D8T634_9EURO|nr:hypothetical protein DSM5745_01335 [Aspergillus mulundensis]RDW94013.1 hypothetical protein DSM5745_01335 [Aspergillus mulundensis]